MGWVQGDQAMTPNMDVFARQSLCFDNAYSTFPLCTPHRGSLMTGKYPFSIGLWTNCKVGLEEKLMLKPQETCIGNVLQDGGYETAYIGKWHLDAPEQNFSACLHPAGGAAPGIFLLAFLRGLRRSSESSLLGGFSGTDLSGKMVGGV